jgi:RNA polymerase sigma factor (sigma-70 family)
MTHRESHPIDRLGRPVPARPAPARERAPECEGLAPLVRAAARGDERAWSELVRRLEPAVRAVARRHRLGHADQEEVVQGTWMRLVAHVDGIRDPAALPGWLTTTARRESLSLLSRPREVPVEDPLPGDTAPTGVDERVLDEERRVALHCAVAALPPRQRALMRTLIARPAMSYDQLSVALGLPRGSIGPTRQRSLERLRRDPHLREAVRR